MSDCKHIWRMRDGLGVDGHHYCCEICGEIFAVINVSSVALDPRIGPTMAVDADDAEVTLDIGTEGIATAPQAGTRRFDA